MIASRATLLFFRITLLTGLTLLLSHCQTAPPLQLAQASVNVPLADAAPTPFHSLPRHEYPFDAQGHYREDWVR